MGCTLAPQVVQILEEETPFHYSTTPSQLLSDMIRWQACQGFVHRTSGKKRPYLPLKKTKKQPYNFTLPGELADLLDEICNMLGQADRGTVISHMILDWVKLSPLRTDFTLAQLATAS